MDGVDCGRARSMNFFLSLPLGFMGPTKHVHLHHRFPTQSQPHDAAVENGFLELANYLRGLCGLEALAALPEEGEEADIVIDLDENANPNEEPMAE